MIYPPSNLPVYEQKAMADEVQVIQLNKNYIWPLGVIRALIIVNISIQATGFYSKFKQSL